MKHFVVRLELQLGNYEKSTVQIVAADSKTEAEIKALRGESHNDIDRHWDEDSTECWKDDGWTYSVRSCIEITPVELVVLKKYI